MNGALQSNEVIHVSGRGSVTKRKNGMYLARVYTGKDAEGHRHWNNKMFAKKKDADDWLNQMLSEQAQGVYCLPSKEKLSAYLPRWLEDVAARRLKERTLEDYRVIVAKYLTLHLGQAKLSELRPDQVQRAYNWIADNHGPALARKCHAVLHTALEQAVKWGMIAKNVSDLVEPPRVPRTEMRPLSPEEVQKFLSEAKGNRYYAYFVLLLDTGIRPGEALALTWDDVDLEKGNVQINKALSTGGRKLIFSDGKTAKSRRSIRITPFTVSVLKAHKRRVAHMQLHSKVWQDKRLAFPNEIGGHSDEHNISQRYFKKILQKAGLPASVRVYDLRHTVATLLLAANTHPKLVSERLGHANTTMTLDRYTHVLPTMQEQVAKTMEQFLGGEQPGGASTSK